MFAAEHIDRRSAYYMTAPPRHRPLAQLTKRIEIRGYAGYGHLATQLASRSPAPHFDQ